MSLQTVARSGLHNLRHSFATGRVECGQLVRKLRDIVRSKEFPLAGII